MLFIASLILRNLFYSRIPSILFVGGYCTFIYTFTSLTVRILSYPFPKAYEIVTRKFLIPSYLKLQLFFMCTVNGVTLHISGDIIPEVPENVIYISNHQSYNDWIIAEMFATRHNSSGGLLYMIKNSIKFVPYYGWNLYLNGCVYIKRNKLFDGKQINRWSKWLTNKIFNYWIVVFPEGTRYDHRLVAKSQLLSIEKGYTPLNNVLFPRVGGFQLILETLPNYIDVVYNVTLVYQTHNRAKNRLDFTDLLLGSISDVYVHVERTPISDIINPSVDISEQGDNISKWLYSSFERKDRMIEKFWDSRELVSPPYETYQLSYRHTLFNLSLYILMTIPLIFTKNGRSFWLKGTFLFAVVGTFTSGVIL